MILAITFFVLTISAGLAWEVWSFYYAPLIDEPEPDWEKEKNDAA